jgi:hypothetical protein
MGQGEFFEKVAYSLLGDFGLWSVKTATADADEGHTRLPKQNTGGSDALWKLPLSQGSHSVDGQQMTIQTNTR